LTNSWPAPRWLLGWGRGLHLVGQLCRSRVAVGQLLRLRAGPQQAAARLVLVDGLAPADAARQTGVSPSALGNTLRACKRGLTLARLACGI